MTPHPCQTALIRGMFLASTKNLFNTIVLYPKSNYTVLKGEIHHPKNMQLSHNATVQSWVITIITYCMIQVTGVCDPSKKKNNPRQVWSCEKTYSDWPSNTRSRAMRIRDSFSLLSTSKASGLSSSGGGCVSCAPSPTHTGPLAGERHTDTNAHTPASLTLHHWHQHLVCLLYPQNRWRLLTLTWKKKRWMVTLLPNH